MVNGVKGFFGRTFCCAKTIPETAPAGEPAGVFTITHSENIIKSTEFTLEEAKEIAKLNRLRRGSAISYKSCTSTNSIGTFRSLSCSSLQSVMSKNTGNYDYYSIHSNRSLGESSFNSCST